MKSYSPLWFIAALVMAMPAFNASAENHPVAIAAQPLPLSDVRLTGGPLQRAQELDAKYLLELQPDRLAHVCSRTPRHSSSS